MQRIALISGLSLFLRMAAPAQAEAIKVFLLAGQSNMSGWTSSSSGLPANLNQSQPNVLIHADGEVDASLKKKWLNNGPDFGHAKGFIGPELNFGKTLSDSMPQTKIALIKYAVGSTELATRWRPPSAGGTTGDMYKNFMAEIDAALASLDAKYVPEMSGVLWMQGEFDGNNLTYANEYQSNLTNFVKDVRAKAGKPNLPFIIGMIDSSNNWRYAGTVRAAERAVAKNVPGVGIFDTRGFPTDNTHYLLNGMIQVGRGFAVTYLDMVRTTTAISARPAGSIAPKAFSEGRDGAALVFCKSAACFDLKGALSFPWR